MLTEGGNIFKNAEGAELTRRIVRVLSRWCQQQGIPPDQIRNRAKTKSGPAWKEGWIELTGDSVHFKTPINGNAKNGFAQTDFMFGDPKWQAFAMKGARQGDQYTGMSKQVMLSSIAGRVTSA